MRFRLDGVVTLVDAVNGASTLDNHAEAVKQAAVADRIVLTKTDLFATPSAALPRRAARGCTGSIRPRRSSTRTTRTAAAALLDCGLYDPVAQDPRCEALAQRRAIAAAQRMIITTITTSTGTTTHIRAFTLVDRQGDPGGGARHVPRPAALDARAEPAAHEGHRADRAETPEQPVVIHGVQHVLHPPVALPAWPDADRRTRLVFIVHDIEPRVVQELFDAFLGVADARPAGHGGAHRQSAGAVRRPRP